jgi:L-fucono-1,5-lactonase
MRERCPPTALPIIDAHHHVWDPSAHAQPWLDSDEALAPLRRVFGIDELVPQATAAGVVATVVVQTITEPAETPELLALAGTHALVVAVVGWTDLAAAHITDALDDLRQLPGGEHLAGIRHPLLTEPDPDWLARSDVRRGLRALAAADLTFDLVVQPAQLSDAVQAAAAVPQLTFVLDHFGNVAADSGRLDDAWAGPFRDLAALPNAVCKLSGILSVPSSPGAHAASEGQQPTVAHLRPYVDLGLECFGPERLMFGSDWPVCTLTASYADVVAAAGALIGELSATEQAAIWANTARATYSSAGA